MEEVVGFHGLGIMGKAMAMNLLRNSFKVTVWNRTLSRFFCDVQQQVCYIPTCFVCSVMNWWCMALPVGETPAAVVKKCIYTIGIPSDPSAALSVVFDKDGVLKQICSGKGYIDMSTVDADTSSKISEVLYDEILPVFDVLGTKSFFLGQVGSGAKMKFVVYMILGSKVNAFSEGLVLADRSGLNPHTLLDVLDLGGIANPMFRSKGPMMIFIPVETPPKGYAAGSCPWGRGCCINANSCCCNEGFKKARSMGLGDLDFSAVCKVFKVDEHKS